MTYGPPTLGPARARSGNVLPRQGRPLLRLAAVGVVLAAFAGCATTTNPIPPGQGTEAPPGQDLKLAVYNVALGAVAGGVGALVNGRDEASLRRLGRGAGWGAVGGGVGYLGKWQAGEVAERGALTYALPARLVHDAGVSITENAARGRPPLSRFSTHLGVVRLDVQTRSGAVRARVLPTATVFFTLLALDGDLDLDVGRSLAFGSPVFLAERGDNVAGLADLGGGLAVPGSVILARDDDAAEFYDTAAHELVHVMQFAEFARAEASWRAGLDPSGRLDRGLGRWVYLDSPALQWAVYYGYEGGDIDAPCKYDNWIEREAEAFGSRRPVGVCP